VNYYYYKTDKRGLIWAAILLFTILFSIHFISLLLFILIVCCSEFLLGSLVGWSVGDGGVFYFHFSVYLFGSGLKFDVCSL